jgi:hypothetical protein
MIAYPKETITTIREGAKRRVYLNGITEGLIYHIPFAGQFATRYNEHNANTLTSTANSSILQWNKVIQQSCIYHHTIKM